MADLETYGEDPADDRVGEARADMRHHPVKVGRVFHTRVQQGCNTALRVRI